MKVTIASLKETEERLKNEPFRIVTPRRSRKYIEDVKGRVNSYQCGGVKVYHSG
jgi:hypothetical protein